jgi:hypothetical protein
MVSAIWISIIATSVLAFFALIAAILAVQAFRRQSKEISALQEQMTDLAFFHGASDGWADGPGDSFDAIRRGREPPRAW